MLCAGWGDIGFISRWCMEITNHSLTSTIILPVGKRVAQIIFFYTDVSSRTYASQGKYQTSDDIKEVIKSWTPEKISPKLYKEEY